MEIFLIGMPGSGKTTLGKKIASPLGLKFIDLDQEIADKEGLTIAQIFEKEGEQYFRKLEAQVLRRIAEKENNFILATGGGTPCFYDSMNYMNSTGITIFLKISTRDLAARVLADNGHERPLLKSEDNKQVVEKLEELYASRIRCYETAHITIDSTTKDPESLIITIKEYLRN